MGKGIRQLPALLVACVALVAALGGTVWAAAKIDGKTIRVKSLPGNRVAPSSLPGDRLKPGSLAADRLAPGSLTGAQVDAASLGQVASAAHAEQANSARSAQTALHAVDADEASRVNGFAAGCRGGFRFFAGACWSEASDAAATAPEAARACAAQGGELPAALTLAAFAQQPDVTLAGGDEWSGDIPVFSGPDAYAVATVSATGTIDFVSRADSKKYRCVVPLLG